MPSEEGQVRKARPVSLRCHDEPGSAPITNHLLLRRLRCICWSHRIKEIVLKMRHLSAVLPVILFGTLLNLPLNAQEMPQPARPPQQAPQQAAQPEGTLMLREGTEVKLKFAEAISSKTAALDDPVTLILDEDLKVGDVVVAKSGSKALAIVTNVKKAGMMGKGGELNIRLESLRSGDAKIHVRGVKSREGEDKLGATVALTVLFGPIGLIKHGKNIEIKEGTPLTAYVADDIALPSVR